MTVPLLLHGTCAGSTDLALGDLLLPGASVGRATYGMLREQVYAVDPDRYERSPDEVDLDEPDLDETERSGAERAWEDALEWAAMAADVWCVDEGCPGWSATTFGLHHDQVVEEPGIAFGCLRVYLVTPVDPHVVVEPDPSNEVGPECVRFAGVAVVLGRLANAAAITARPAALAR